MPQDAEHIKDHFELFRGEEYKDMIANKRANFENRHPEAEVERVRERERPPLGTGKNVDTTMTGAE